MVEKDAGLCIYKIEEDGTKKNDYHIKYLILIPKVEPGKEQNDPLPPKEHNNFLPSSLPPKGIILIPIIRVIQTKNFSKLLQSPYI